MGISLGVRPRLSSSPWICSARVTRRICCVRRLLSRKASIMPSAARAQAAAKDPNTRVDWSRFAGAGAPAANETAAPMSTRASPKEATAPANRSAPVRSVRSPVFSRLNGEGWRMGGIRPPGWAAFSMIVSFCRKGETLRLVGASVMRQGRPCAAGCAAVRLSAGKRARPVELKAAFAGPEKHFASGLSRVSHDTPMELTSLVKVRSSIVLLPRCLVFVGASLLSKRGFEQGKRTCLLCCI